MRFEGTSRAITITNDKVIITARDTLFGKIDGKNIKDVEINFNEITSIDCKDASLFSNGFIKLYVNGRASMETTIMFLPRGGVYQQALSFVRTLNSLIAEQKYKKVSSISPADEIKKYKELYDMGAITLEEFEKKKKQLLNL
jgi:hypothetical protein